MPGDPFDAIMQAADPALVIVTAAEAGERAGCLVGFHSQSSIEPRRYCVWLSKANHTFRVAQRSAWLAVHFLAAGDQDLAERFGTRTGDDGDKFAGLAVRQGPGGVPGGVSPSGRRAEPRRRGQTRRAGKIVAKGEPDPRDETPQERDDRNLIELLQELRVAGLGVQVLFGFLLAIPFSMGFARLSPAQRDIYVTTLVLSVLATALLLGPVAYHRLIFRMGRKEQLVRAANVMAIAGLGVVGLAVSSAMALVLSYVAPGLPAVVITAVALALFAGLWFGYPLSRRR